VTTYLGPPPYRLFVYGTLQDAELFAVVAGRPMSGFRPEPARLCRARVIAPATATEGPLLAHGSGTAPGLLLSGLDPATLARLDFYEAPEYRLLPARVRRRKDGRAVRAAVFQPAAPERMAPWSWSLLAWKHQHKRSAVAAARRFMAYFGAPSETDLDAVWRQIQETLGPV
jgi:hypothetical protein